MRKLILNLAVSLDGFIEGPNGEYDWCFTDQDYGMEAFFADIDTVFMGRKSYDLITETGDIAHLLTNQIIVFSDTLTSPAFGNIGILRSKNIREDVIKIKEEKGASIWLFGGSSLISSMLSEGLVDEIRLSVHPVILGGGKPLFTEIKERADLNLVEVQPYDNGLVQLGYQVLPKINLDDIAGFGDQFGD